MSVSLGSGFEESRDRLAEFAVAHTLIFFYMLVSLNVAINSYDYTLLSLLISNQFVEIKGCE